MSENNNNQEKKTTATQPPSPLPTPASETPSSGLMYAGGEKSTLLPSNRPISPSSLQIVKTYSSVGSIRPVVKSGLKIKNMITVSGNRPIVSSGLKISQEYKIMGNRPVASNQIDDPVLLMGYLD